MKIRLLFLFISVCSFSLISVSAKEEPQYREPIRIGVMLCLTGDCAEWGTNGLKGAKLAVEEINESGGILGRQVELSIQDSHDTTPSKTVSAFKKLRLSGITKIIGPTWTAGAMPIAPIIAKDSEIIVTSPSVGVKGFNETSSNILNIWPHDEKGTRKLAKYAASKGWKTAAIFGSEDPWVVTQSDTFSEEFKKLGGEIVKRVEPLPDSRELQAEALQIKNADPDVVFYSNYQVDVISKELAKLNFHPPKLAILMEKERVKAANGTLEGAVFALYEEPIESFQQNFKEKFGTEPGISADTTYDAVHLYAKTIRETKSTESKQNLEYLLDIQNYKGASGIFTIDNEGAVNKKPVLWMVKGLTYTPVVKEEI